MAPRTGWAHSTPAAPRRARRFRSWPAAAALASPAEPGRAPARPGADRLLRSSGYPARAHSSARLRQVSMSGKAPARLRDGFVEARVALVRARWNEEVTRALAKGALERALAAGALVDEFEVAGSFELPPAVAALARTGRYEAVVPLGCLIRGETPHFDVLAHTVARALADLATSLPVAITFGVLTCESIEQARARSGPERNAGAEAMDAALELVALRHAISARASRASRSAPTARSRSTRAKRRRSPGSR